MPKVITQFFSFDTLIGGSLAKGIYFLGLVLIAGRTLFMVAGSFAFGFWGFLGTTFIMAPISLVVSVVVWRFICELFVAIYEIHEKLNSLTQMQAEMAEVSKAAPDSPQDPAPISTPAQPAPSPSLDDDAAPQTPPSPAGIEATTSFEDDSSKP